MGHLSSVDDAIFPTIMFPHEILFFLLLSLKISPFSKLNIGVPVVAQWLTNPTRNHEVAGSIPALAQWVTIRRCRELWLGCRRGSDPALLWLWRRLAATALIRPLAWEPPYAAGAAQEITKRLKKKKTIEWINDHRHDCITSSLSSRHWWSYLWDK